MSPERRQHPRCLSSVETVCTGVSGPVPSFQASIVDISQGGVGLLVDQPLHVGNLLRIKLSRVVEGWVVHATPTQDGKWVVGCVLAWELSESEVRALAAHPSIHAESA
jgi:hypothetical protein